MTQDYVSVRKLVARFKLHPTCFHDHNFQTHPRETRNNVSDIEIDLKTRKKNDHENTALQSEKQSLPRFVDHAIPNSYNVNSGAGVIPKEEPDVLMAIVPVILRHPNGKDRIKTYAFLDCGSTGCFALEDVRKAISIKCERTSFILGTMHGQSSVDSYVIENLIVSDLNEINTIELPKVYVRDQIPCSVSNIPTRSVMANWDYLRDLDIPEISENVEIELLIGVNCAKAHEPLRVIPSQHSGPYAVLTRLGWTICGVIGAVNHCVVNCNRVFVKNRDNESVHEVVINETVREVDNVKLIRQMFENDFIESELSSFEVGLSLEDKQFLDIVDNSIFFQNGHYYIPLIFRDRNVSLPNNKSQAYKRLFWLKRKLLGNPQLKSSYCEFMDNMMKNQYAVEAPSDQLLTTFGSVYYICHHSVFNPRKQKTRVVFDLSAKLNGKSLNDYFLQGPDLTNSLFGVLCRFRERPVAFIGDIESMFYQVKVPEGHRDFLRFIWWPNGNMDMDPVEYKMTCHPFGAISSPSCANYALKRTADDFSNSMIVSDTINHNFYVDDCLRSCDNSNEAIKLATDLINVCAKGGFNLTKFSSNDRTFLKFFSDDKLAKNVKELDLNYDSLPIERALGVHWCVENDQFGFRITLKDKPLTRRGILSVVASVFDPLGFAAPYILKAKEILREMCRDNIGWDDPVSEHHHNEWVKWRDQLIQLEQLKIERCVQPEDFGTVVKREVHLFSDASNTAYGSVGYLRIINDRNEVHCAFIVGKARLAPVKPLTIPRLELSAAALSAKLSSTIVKELELKPDKVVFWTDSTTVLRYIRNERKRFHVFVANRIATIRRVSEPINWFYVPTVDNPADDSSRGLTARDLIQHSRWLTGPEFLSNTNFEWPNQPNLNNVESADPEVKPDVSSFAVTNGNVSNPTKDFIEYFSSWSRLKYAVAWLLRFMNYLYNLSNNRKLFKANLDSNLNEIERDVKIKRRMEGIRCSIAGSKNLTLKELSSAELAILKFLQHNSFSEVFKDLKDGQTRHISKKNSLYRLDPIISEGLIKVGGRLRHSDIPESVKHPIILPKSGHVTSLIIRDVHEKLGHSGRGHTITALRETFWIVKCNSIVRHVLSKCVICRKLRAPVVVQKMADLPRDRVTQSLPFESVGVDYFGPFVVKEGRKELKRYGVIFTCLVIRAIHIEIACSLDTNSFLQALRRFVCRRGQVKKIRSDNGTNFCGGEREMRVAIDNWNQNQIHKDLQQRKIEWIFNPPTGSHHGGVWERQIRTIRKVLNGLLKVNNTVSLSDESLRTLMCEVESIVNSRPLTFTSDDPDDLNPLTPNMLLNLRSSWILPPGEFQREDIYARKAWRQVQYLADSFWNRWRKEYLVLLQERKKWTKTELNIDVNAIVLVVDDNLPRNQWCMGRVISVNSDSLGHVRSVTVKTSSSIFQRPISKLVQILP